MSRRISWVTAFGCFIIYASVSTSIGPVLPQLSKDFALTPDLIGIILAIRSFGGLMAILGGWISDRMSRLLIGAISTMMLGAGSLLLGTSPNPVVVAASLLLMSTAAGFLESSLNAFVSNLYSERRGLSVNLFHIGWNVGSTIGPSLAAFLIVTTGSWRNVYLLPIPALFSISILMVLLNKNAAQIRNGEGSPRNSLSISPRLLFKFLPIALIGFFYVAAEMGLSTWLAYILQDLGSAIFEAGLATGLFWGLMGLGRLIWAPIIDRAGYGRPLIVASGLALICMVSASSPLPLGPKMVLWASSGFFLAPMFPTLIAWVVSLAPELGGSLSGLIFTMGTLGLIFSDYFVGLVTAIFGAETSQYIFVFFTVAMLVNILAVHLLRDKKL
ncbi:MAG: sugar MFS transporter [Candidatus Bathyarchaeia archaeon]